MEITNSSEKTNNETIHPIIGKDQWEVMSYLINSDNEESNCNNNGIHIIENDQLLDVIDSNISSLSGNLGIDSSGGGNDKNTLGISPKRPKCILNNEIGMLESIDSNNNNSDGSNSVLSSTIKWNNSINSPISNSDNNQIITPPPANHSYHKYNSINASSTISTTPSKNIQKDELDIDLDLDVEIDVEEEIDENEINNGNDNEDIEVDYDSGDNCVKGDSLFNNKQGIFFIKKNNTNNAGINQHHSTSKNINNGTECFDNSNSNANTNNKNTCNSNTQQNDQYKSGYKGVSWNKRMQSWLAFWTEGQRRRSKTFNSKIYGFDVARSEAIAFLKAKQNELQSMGQLQGKKSMHYIRQNIDNISSLKTMNGIYLPGNKYNVNNNQNGELLCDIKNIKDNDENRNNLLLENDSKNNNIDNIKNCNIKNGIHPLINGQDFINTIENKNILQRKSLFSTYGYNDANCNIVEKLGLPRINYPNIICDENIIQNNKVTTATIGQYYTLQDLKGVPSVSNFQFYNTTPNNNNNNINKCVLKNDNNNGINNKIINNISRNVINNKIEKYDDNINLTNGLFKTSKNINSNNVNNNDSVILSGNNGMINLNGKGSIMGNMILMNNSNVGNNNMNNSQRNMNTSYKGDNNNLLTNKSQESTNVEASNTNTTATSLLQMALNTINDNNIKMNELINCNQDKILNGGMKSDENDIISNYNTKVNMNLSSNKHFDYIKNSENNKVNHTNIINYCGDINKDIKDVINVVSNIKNDDQSIINNDNNECWPNIFQYNNLMNNAVNYNLMNTASYNNCNSNALHSEINNVNNNFLNAINVLENVNNSNNNNILSGNKLNENNNK
ncbi:hypothetical protein FG386_001531 [Cryptosporidium ryanae]|uniref:uncharacterized protein n=1 Tax=Cryptosporidium ryanae TaxID=515981 RepID=UPI00351A9C89|nr:hypothetical protein FG386_001531 [Cryptosporidium ryanae]